MPTFTVHRGGRSHNRAAATRRARAALPLTEQQIAYVLHEIRRALTTRPQYAPLYMAITRRATDPDHADALLQLITTDRSAALAQIVTAWPNARAAVKEAAAYLVGWHRTRGPETLRSILRTLLPTLTADERATVIASLIKRHTAPRARS